MALEEHETYRAIMVRDSVFGLPNGWFMILLLPLTLGYGLRVYWLMLFIFPMAGVLYWAKGQDEYWLESFLLMLGYGKRYDAL